MTNDQLLLLKADMIARSGVGGALEELWAQGADGAISEWYNLPAEAGEFGTPLLVWKNFLSIREINAAVVWTQKPAGADVPTQTLNCLIWQNMIWANGIDMSDQQVRQGIADIWGSGTDNDTNLRAAGKRTGTRFELVFAGAGVGGARVTPMINMVCQSIDVTNAKNAT
jgi:hypothetical protein